MTVECEMSVVEEFDVWEKHCGRCDRTLPGSFFHLCRAKPDGLAAFCRECTRVYFKGYYEKNKRHGKQRREWWRDHNGKKRACHLAVFNAIKSGKLKPRSCEKCAGGPPDAHHDDYSKPLEVRWLCRGCHTQHHLLERRKEVDD